MLVLVFGCGGEVNSRGRATRAEIL